MSRVMELRVAAAVILAVGMALGVARPANAQMSDAAKVFWVYVGNYAPTGIQLFQLDTTKGKLTPAGVAGPGKSWNFLAIAPNRKFMYACGDISEAGATKAVGGVLAYSIDATTGKLTLLNQQPSAGDDPCFITIDPTGKNALITNYNTATIAVLPIGPDGKLGPAQSVITDTGGSNVVPDRQAQAHAHSINLDPSGKLAFVCDLGADKVNLFKFDPDKGMLAPSDPPFVALPPGSGPRHLTWSPDRKMVYVVNELAATVAVFAFDADHSTLVPKQTIATLLTFKGQNTSAEVQMDPTGHFLYASNRLDTNFLTVYSVDKNDGTLTLVEYVDTAGKTPRNFRIDPTGQFLIVVNQDGNNLVMFQINPTTGRLTPAAAPFTVASPVCVKYLAVEQ